MDPKLYTKCFNSRVEDLTRRYHLFSNLHDKRTASLLEAEIMDLLQAEMDGKPFLSMRVIK